MPYQFHHFSLDETEGLLRRDGEAVPLRAKAVQVLLTFLKSGGRLLTKQKLIEDCWAGRTVSDDAIYAQIHAIRRALGDQKPPYRFIETLHGQGFQMIAPVARREIAATIKTSVNGNPKSKTGGPPRIAVLPFQLRGTDDTSLSHGVCDDMIDALSRLQSLEVVSRLSTFRFSTDDLANGNLAEKLRVDYAVSGTVEQVGDRVRINVELADVREERVVWSENHTEKLAEIWDIRRQIINHVAATLDTHILTDQARQARLVDPSSLTAWQLYHLGMDDMFSGIPRKADNARDLFGQALSIDRRFARAHAAMSQVVWWQMMSRPGDIDGLRDQMNYSANLAVECNRLDPFANSVMGRAQWLSDGAEAGSAWYERAIAVSPSYAHAIGAYANYLSMDGQAEKALSLMKKAIDLSPADPQLAMMYGVMSVSKLLMGDAEEAVSWSRKALAQPGQSLLVLQGSLMALHEAGQIDEADRLADIIRAGGQPVSTESYLATLPIRSPHYISLIERSISDYKLGS